MGYNSHKHSQERLTMNKFTAVFERDGNWSIGYVGELSGADTQSRTLEEARENLKETVAKVIKENRELTQLEVWR